MKLSREFKQTFFTPFFLCPLTGDAQPLDLEKEIQTKEALSSARAAKTTSASGHFNQGLISTLGNKSSNTKARSGLENVLTSAVFETFSQ